MGNIFVSIALFGWIPVVLLLFAVLPPRRAVVAAFVTGWLFLPMAGFKLAQGIPVYDKVSATSLGVLLGVMLFDSRRLLAFRPAWFDLPMAIWCLCPFASSISNDLGAYDGCSAVFSQIVIWGAPYFIGRMYFTDLVGLRELAWGLFIGAVVYVPLCLFEIRMSPQLSNLVYGISGRNLLAAVRGGFWRPQVFLGSGLMLSMYLAAASLLGLWMWRSRTMPRDTLGVPSGMVLAVLIITTILCQSVGAIILLAAGCCVLFFAKGLRSRIPMILLIGVAPAFVAARLFFEWDARGLVTAAANRFNEERAESLETRLKNEDSLMEKAMQRPMFGWGRWGRARVYAQDGSDLSLTDGLWIITLGDQGLVGLGALAVTFLLPSLMLCLRLRAADWTVPAMAPAIAVAVVVVLRFIDCIPNSHPNPLFTLALGGLAVFGCGHFLQSITTTEDVRLANIVSGRSVNASGGF